MTSDRDHCYVAIVLGSGDSLDPKCISLLCDWLSQSDHSLSLISSKSLASHATELIWSAQNEISDADLRILKLACNEKGSSDYHVSFLRKSASYQHKRLVIFDMDSTLIQQEVIDEIARFAGVMDQVSVCVFLLIDL